MLNCPIVLSEVPRYLLGPITARGFSDCQIGELAKLLPYWSEVLKKGQHKAKRISKNGWQNIPPPKKMSKHHSKAQAQIPIVCPGPAASSDLVHCMCLETRRWHLAEQAEGHDLVEAPAAAFACVG